MAEEIKPKWNELFEAFVSDDQKLYGKFIQTGEVLLRMRGRAWTTTIGMSFDEFISSLAYPKKYYYTAVDLAEAIGDGVLDIDDAEIVKPECWCICLDRVLDLIKGGKNDEAEEILICATSGDIRELKKAMGHKMPKNKRTNKVRCDHCGNTVNGAKYTPEEKDDKETDKG